MFTSNKGVKSRLRKFQKLKTRIYLFIYDFSDLGSSRNEWKKNWVVFLSMDVIGKRKTLSAFSKWDSSSHERLCIVKVLAVNDYTIHFHRLNRPACGVYQSRWVFSNCSLLRFRHLKISQSLRFPELSLVPTTNHKTCIQSHYLVGQFALSSRP